MIKNGLFSELVSKPEFSKYIKGVYPPRHRSGAYPLLIKTQTRRLNRGIYSVGKDYAVQSKRGVMAEQDIRIVVDRIWEESCTLPGMVTGGYFRSKSISKESALAEGGYTPENYEKVFRELNLKWNGWSRWAFKFHVEIKE